jgi:hypothetical protein
MRGHNYSRNPCTRGDTRSGEFLKRHHEVLSYTKTNR